MFYFLSIFTTFFIFTLPILLKREIFGINVYSFFLVVLFFQLILRNLLMYFNIPSYEYVQSLMKGMSFDQFLLSSFIHLLSSLVIVFCYMLSRKDYKFLYSFNNFSFLFKKPPQTRILLWIILLLSVSIFANYQFFSFFSFSFFSSFGLSSELDSYNSMGYLRELAGLSILSCFLSLAYFFESKNKQMKLIFAFFAFLSFLLIIGNALLVSKRAILIVTLIGIWVISSFYNYRIPNFIKIIFFMLFLSILVFMTSFRINFQEFSFQGVDLNKFLDVSSYLIVNNGGIDVMKFQHLVNYVDTKGDYKNGELLSNLFLLAVPRSVWSEKPVNADTQFGIEVYEADTYGAGAVPPGILGEFFWDFSWIGVIVGSIIAGLVMGFLDKLLFFKKESIFIKVLFSVSLIWTGMNILGSGLVSTSIGVLVLIIPLIFIFFFSNLNFKS